MQEKNWNWIDGFKGIAILGIVCIHSGAANLPSVLGKIGAIGSSGVQIFYLISGYLAFVSMDSFVKKERNEYYRWIGKKIVRLMPLFYIALFIGCLVEGDAYWYGSEGKITIPNILSHVFFVHGLIPRYTNSIIGGEWYLGTLVLFYLVVPLLHKYLDCVEKTIIFLSGITVGGACITKILFYFVNSSMLEDAYIYVSYIGTFGFWVQFPVFVLGITIYFILKENRLANIRNKKNVAYVILFFSFFLLGGEVSKTNNIIGISGAMLFAFWYSGMIVSQQIYPCGLFKVRVLQLLGKYSYGIYLFHFFVIKFYEKFIHLTMRNEILAWFVKFLICLCLSYMVSFMLTKYIDEPIKRFFQRNV